MDRKGSKVLKVALSAALAVAFTPVAAAPAFATQLNAEQTTEVVKDALSYTYQGNAAYTYSGTFFVDGTTVYAGYTPADIGNKGVNVMYDMARFLGALYRYNDTPAVNAIRYNNDIYTWQPTVASGEGGQGLNGSNWVKKGGTKEDTLVKTIVTKIGSGLTDNYASSLTFDISNDDGKTYSSISLVASISMAQVINKDNTKAGEATDLASALSGANAGQTVRMLSNTITNAQLTLKPGVTLDGYGKSLIHLSNASEASDKAAISFTASAEGDKDAAIKNLTIIGPNTTPATKAEDGTVTQHKDEGEYAIKASGAKAALDLYSVTIKNADAGVSVSEGATVNVKSAFVLNNVERCAAEVANGELAIDPAASVSYSETKETPFAVIQDNGGSIAFDSSKLSFTKVKNNSGHNYYLTNHDKNGSYFYASDLTESAQNGTDVSFKNKGEYALLKFIPSTTDTYCFSSEGAVADAAAELYSMNSGAMGSKIASGDNEQGENFRVFAKLTGGTTYILRVGVSSAAKTGRDSGATSVKVAKASAESLDSYVVSLPANTYYYDDEKLTAGSSKLNTTVKSAINGTALAAADYDKAIYKVTDSNGSLQISEQATNEITADGKYALKVTAKGGGKYSGSALCYFDVKDAANIADYDFKYNNTLVFANKKAADITALAPKGYRYGSNTATFTESNLKVVGWYKVDANGTVANDALADAPEAVGNYALKLSPVNATGENKFNTDSTTELKFSITRGKVAAPSARTGLTYTGSAQVGVPAGANYTLSGTASATNAGTYSCTATLAEGYSWTDGTTAPKTFTWSIAKAKIAVPSGNSGLTYNGKVQTGVTKSTSFTLTGTTTATEPGEYTCYATPASNYMWTDGTTATKTVKWTLGKADAAIVATPSTVVVESGDKATVTLKQAGTAAYTVASADSKVATASVAGSSVSISAKGSGSTTVTVSTAATARYAASSTAITVCVPKDEDETGSAVTTVVGADGSITKVTNKFKVVTPYDASDSDVVPTVAFTGTSVKSGKVTVPSSVTLSDGITYKVTSIAPKAFKGAKITGVVIPKSVTRIGKDAFAGCKKLKTISFHNKVKSIGANVLKGSAAKSATLKSSKLSKTSIKNLVKGSKLTTVKCSGLSKKTKAKYAKWAKSYKAGVKFK